MRWAAAVLLMVLLAGCAASTVQPASQPRAPEAAVPFQGEPLAQDHDHNGPSLHNTSLNLKLVARVIPYGNGTQWGQGSINEFAINGNRIFVSRSDPEGGFAIVDATDLRHPQVIGDFHAEGGADVEVTSDGAFVLLMTQRTTPGAQTLDNPTAREVRGIDVVDVRDPAHPKLSSFLPLPTNGPHTASYRLLPDGREIVAIQTYDLVTDPTSGAIAGANPATQRVYLAQLLRDALGARLQVEGTYEVTDPPAPGQMVFPHDSFLEPQKDGRILLYVAYWDAGVRIVDVTDLSQPKEVAAYRDFAPSRIVQMHDVRTFPAPVAGKHVMVAAPEIVTAPETGQVTFVDVTDPAHPAKLGWWHLPGNLTVDKPFDFSPHVFDTDSQGRVVIGHYHAGVWLIDAHDPADPVTLGFYLPHEPRPGWTGMAPDTWGARFFRGHIVASDSGTGLYILEAAPGLLDPLPPGVIAG